MKHGLRESVLDPRAVNALLAVSGDDTAREAT
jgi:hypothetical protein